MSYGNYNLDGAEYGKKYKAYEQCMHRNGNFGLQGDALEAQYRRQGEGIQFFQIKDAKRAEGREYGRMLAEERKLLTNGTDNSSRALVVINREDPKKTIGEILFGDKKKGNIADTFRADRSLNDAPLGRKTVYEQPMWSNFEDRAFAEAKAKNSRIKYIGHDGIERTMTPQGKIIVNTADVEKIEAFEKNRVKDWAELIRKKGASEAADGTRLPVGPVRPNGNDLPVGPVDVNPPKPPVDIDDGSHRILPPWNGPDDVNPPKPTPGKEPYCKKWFGKIDQKLDDIKNQVDENGRAITGLGEKVDDLGNKVDDMSRQVGDLSNNVSDLRQGVLGLNEKIDDVADNLSDKIDDLGHGLNDKMDDIAKNLDDKIDDLGKGLGDKVDDLGKKLGNQIGELGTKVDGRFNNVDDALKGLSDKIDDLGKQLSQKNKKFALIGGALVLAAGIIGYFIGKSKEDKVVQPIKNDEQDGNDTIPKNDTISLDSIRRYFPPVQPIDTTEVVNDTINDTTVDTEAKEEAKEEAKDTDKVSKKIKLNENGEYITVWGDSFWNIAERVLEDKYADQPEKFENLTKSEKEKQIREEMIRIMALNGFELDENGWFPEPMLYTNKHLQITDTLGNAA